MPWTPRRVVRELAELMLIPAVWVLDFLYGDLIQGAGEVFGVYTPTREERARRRREWEKKK